MTKDEGAPTKIPGIESLSLQIDPDPLTVYYGKSKPILNVIYSDSGVQLIWGWVKAGKKYSAKTRMRSKERRVANPAIVPLTITRVHDDA